MISGCCHWTGKGKVSWEFLAFTINLVILRLLFFMIKRFFCSIWMGDSSCVKGVKGMDMLFTEPVIPNLYDF